MSTNVGAKGSSPLSRYTPRGPIQAPQPQQEISKEQPVSAAELLGKVQQDSMLVTGQQATPMTAAQKAQEAPRGQLDRVKRTASTEALDAARTTVGDAAAQLGSLNAKLGGFRSILGQLDDLLADKSLTRDQRSGLEAKREALGKGIEGLEGSIAAQAKLLETATEALDKHEEALKAHQSKIKEAMLKPLSEQVKEAERDQEFCRKQLDAAIKAKLDKDSVQGLHDRLQKSGTALKNARKMLQDFQESGTIPNHPKELANQLLKLQMEKAPKLPPDQQQKVDDGAKALDDPRAKLETASAAAKGLINDTKSSQKMETDALKAELATLQKAAEKPLSPAARVKTVDRMMEILSKMDPKTRGDAFTSWIKSKTADPVVKDDLARRSLQQFDGPEDKGLRDLAGKFTELRSKLERTLLPGGSLDKDRAANAKELAKAGVTQGGQKGGALYHPELGQVWSAKELGRVGTAGAQALNLDPKLGRQYWEQAEAFLRANANHALDAGNAETYTAVSRIMDRMQALRTDPVANQEALRSAWAEANKLLGGHFSEVSDLYEDRGKFYETAAEVAKGVKSAAQTTVGVMADLNPLLKPLAVGLDATLAAIDSIGEGDSWQTTAIKTSLAGLASAMPGGEGAMQKVGSAFAKASAETAAHFSQALTEGKPIDKEEFARVLAAKFAGQLASLGIGEAGEKFLKSDKAKALLGIIAGTLYDQFVAPQLEGAA